MKIAHLTILSYCLFAARAMGQSIDMTLSWMETLAGTHTPVPNPNGVLEPGESARISVTVGYPPIGTIVNVGGLSREVAGFRYTDFALGCSRPGNWTSPQAPSGFGAGFSPPIGGTFMDFAWVGQAPPALGMSPNSSNPHVNVWNALYTPWVFSAQTTEFGFGIVFDSPAYLYIRNGFDPSGNPLFASIEWWSWNYGPNLNIPVVPSPSSILILAATFFASQCRQSRRTTSRSRRTADVGHC